MKKMHAFLQPYEIYLALGRILSDFKSKGHSPSKVKSHWCANQLNVYSHYNGDLSLTSYHITGHCVEKGELCFMKTIVCREI